MTQPMVPIRDGPTTGQRVEILWDVPAVWSMAAVDEYHPESGHHSVTYDSGFKHTSELVATRWKYLEKPGSSHEPAQNVSGKQAGHALVGTEVRVFWDRFTSWEKGTVGQCDVFKGSIGKCTVKRDDGYDWQYNFSDPELVWRGQFVPDPRRWAFPKTEAFGNATNMMEVDVDTRIIDRVRRLYEHHVMPNVVDDVSESFSSSPRDAGGETVYTWNRQFAGGKFGSDIKWISPGDLNTHQTLSSVFHELGVGRKIEHLVDVREPRQPRQHQTSAPDVDPRLRVYIPSFVVRVRVRKSYHHLDWPVAAGSNGLTLMTPLYDMANQTEGCNLLYKDANGDERVYKYTMGKAVIFGGGLFHSSQPCRPRSRQEVQRPWAFLCFNFGTDKIDYWPTIKENIECSGKLIVQPDGEVAPEALCTSYNAGLKEGEIKFKEELEAEGLLVDDVNPVPVDHGEL